MSRYAEEPPRHRPPQALIDLVQEWQNAPDAAGVKNGLDLEQGALCGELWRLFAGIDDFRYDAIGLGLATDLGNLFASARSS